MQQLFWGSRAPHRPKALPTKSLVLHSSKISVFIESIVIMALLLSYFPVVVSCPKLLICMVLVALLSMSDIPKRLTQTRFMFLARSLDGSRVNVLLQSGLVPHRRSWSRVRDDINGGGPTSEQHIDGVPNLSPADQARVALGNLTFKEAVLIISECISTHTCVFLENPSGGMLFDAPPIRRLRAKEYVSVHCQYNAPWRMRTKVLVWRADITYAPANICKGRAGM